MMVLSLALTLPYQKIPTVMGRLIFDSRMSGSGRTCTCKRTSKKLCLRGQRQNQKSRGISLALIIRKRKKNKNAIGKNVVRKRNLNKGESIEASKPVPSQVNEPVVDLEKVKATDYVRATSHSVSLPCPEPPSKKKKIAIKEDANRDNIPKSSITTSSRGQKLVAMALKRPELSATNKIRTVLESRGLPREKVEKAPSRRPEKTLQTAGKREIDPSLVKKISDEPIGSGTFGNVFLAEYRGMKVAVKEMKGKDGSRKETERCRQEVLHKANILMNLGDHPNLPFLFGMCTKHQPFSIVLQFHGTGNKSLTLHRVLRKKMMNIKRTATVFKDLAETLHYIHNKGLLHNDLKTNNVIMHCGEKGNFFPIIIDFGKSKYQGNVQGYKRTTDSDYIATEVKLGAPESTASDMFSFGKMLEKAVVGQSFYSLFSSIVVNTTSSVPSERNSAVAVSLLLEKLHNS